MRGTPFCTDFMINGLRRICESLPAFTSWSTGYESVYSRLSTQDSHNQMKHTEFYEECYGNVKDIAKNLSQKNYMETENYKL